jgi:hypothetical protein
LLLGGCSIKHRALVSVADSLSRTGESGTYATDNDPDLVRDAIPFGLKTMEGLALELPDHVPLRAALARGFTQYSYAFLQSEAEFVADKDFQRAKALRIRATKLYLRARDHGLLGLKLERGITIEDLRGENRAKALEKCQKEDVELLYWTLAPWAAAVALNKTDMALVGDLGAISAMLERALQLDESYGKGALHEFSLAFDPSRPGGTTRDRQMAHFVRAVELSGGKRLSVYVSWAENVQVPAQDKAGFQKELQQVLAFDVDEPSARDNRLSNVLTQRRAAWLQTRVPDLFLDES